MLTHISKIPFSSSNFRCCGQTIESKFRHKNTGKKFFFRVQAKRYVDTVFICYRVVLSIKVYFNVRQQSLREWLEPISRGKSVAP